MPVTRRLLLLGVASAILLAACAADLGTPAPGASTRAGSAAPTEAPAGGVAASAPLADYKACVAFDVPGLDDRGFNALAKKALDEAAAAGSATASAQATSPADYETNVQDLIDIGCRTVVLVGPGQTQAAIDLTLANPDIAFVQVDATWDEAGPDGTKGTADDLPYPPNFTGLTFRVDEAAAVAGYLAAGFSRTGKIATYGAQRDPAVTRYLNGIAAGVRIYDERNGAHVRLLGWDAARKTGTFVDGDNPWNDPAKGGQLARRFLDQGADVVFPVAGRTGDGTLQAMLGAGKWAIGAETDQAVALPKYAGAILTSVEKVVDVAVLDAINRNAAGEQGGEDLVGTLANGGVRIAPFHDLDSEVPGDLRAAADQLALDIASGAIRLGDYLK